MGNFFEVLMRVDSESGPAKRDLEELGERLARFARENAEATAAIDTAQGKAQLDELKALLKQYGAEDVSAKANVLIARAQKDIAVLEAELAKLDGQDVEVDVDVRRGVTERIAALAGQVERLGSEVGGVSTGGSSGGAGLASLAGSAAGAVGPLGILAFTIGPAVVAILFAIAASAGAAVLGLGAIGLAFGATLIPAIGLGVAALLRFKSQSDTAGTAAHTLKTRVTDIGHAIGDALGPGADAVFRGLAAGLGGVDDLFTRLKPNFTGLGQAIGGSLTSVLKELTSPEWGAFFERLTNASARIVPALTGSFLGFLNLLRNITTSALPFLRRGLQDVSGFMKGLGSDKIDLSGVMSQLHSWLNLIGAVGSALLGLFKGAAGPGQQFVDFLAKGAHNLADWANSAKGQAAIHDFFAKALPVAEQLVTAIAHLVVGFLQLSAAVMPVVTAILSAFNSLSPSIAAVVAAVVGLVAAIGPLKLLGGIFGGFGGEAAGAAAGAGLLEGGLGGLLAAAAPVALVVGGIVGTAVLLNKVFGDSSDSTKEWTDTLGDFNTADKAAIDSLGKMREAQQKQASAQERINRLTAEGKLNTDAGSRAVKDFSKAYLDNVAQTQRHAQAVADASTSLGSLRKQYDDVGQSIKDLQSGKDPLAFGHPELLEQARQKYAELNAQLQLADLNFRRLRDNKSPVTPEFLAAINQIKAFAGGKVAAKLELSGAPAVVRTLAGIAQQAKDLGATPKKIKTILQGDGTVAQKLAALQALLARLKDKQVKAEAKTSGEGPLQALLNFLGRLKDKAVKAVVGTKGENPLQALLRLIGQLRDKTVSATANAHGESSVRSLASSIADLRDKTITLTTVHQTINKTKAAAAATGVKNFIGGLLRVGEDGEELMNVPQGTDVYTHRESRRILDALASGATDLQHSLLPSVGFSLPAPAVAGGGGNTQINFDISSPPGTMPDGETLWAQLDARLRLGGLV